MAVATLRTLKYIWFPLLLLLGLLYFSVTEIQAQKAGEKSAQQPAALKADDVAFVLDNKSYKVAEVDQSIMSKPQLAQLWQAARTNAGLQNHIRLQAANEMVNRKLLLREARQNVKIEGSKIDQEVNKAVEQAYGGEDRLKQALEQFKISVADFKKDLGEDYVISEYVKIHLAKDVTVSDEQVKEHYDKNAAKYAQPEQVHARHILLKLDQNADEADVANVQKKINAIRDEIVNQKKDFAEVAKEKSEGPSGPRGGELGFFEKGRMVPEFEKVAFSLKPGEVSEPVRTRFGFHLIKVEEKKAGVEPSFESAKAQVKKELEFFQTSEKIKTKLDELRKSANLEMKLKGLKG